MTTYDGGGSYDSLTEEEQPVVKEENRDSTTVVRPRSTRMRCNSAGLGSYA